ncbi:Cytochrome P450 2K4 [Labeo rohita]|uniref:Cytochrome P450 2K4 n=1 Tax=Labeo rohita TaxID=84645 RepID=A0ABQ8L3V6_LABRO|nr:Cytochrome P450 2K4 [Labeo rohita]
MLCKFVLQLSKKYGSVFTVHFGPKKAVVLAGYKTGMVERSNQNIRILGSSVIQIYNMCPFLGPWLKTWRTLMENMDSNKREIKKLVKVLQKTLNPLESRGFIDTFLIQKESIQVNDFQYISISFVHFAIYILALLGPCFTCLTVGMKEFNNRQTVYKLNIFVGVVFVNGESWKELRWFALTKEETCHLQEEFEKFDGRFEGL